MPAHVPPICRPRKEPTSPRERQTETTRLMWIAGTPPGGGPTRNINARGQFQLRTHFLLRRVAGVLRCARAASTCVFLRSSIPLLPLAMMATAAATPAAEPLAYAPSAVPLPEAAAVGAIDAATSGGADPSSPAPRPAIMSETLRLSRISTALAVHGEAERHCLATAVYFEARGESVSGQAAVAQVVLNRTRTQGFPRTVCGVVYEGKGRRNACQFSFACDGKPETVVETKAWRRALRVADDVQSGKRRYAKLDSATHYHATYVSPYWAPAMKRLAQIGRHVFYAE